MFLTPTWAAKIYIDGTFDHAAWSSIVLSATGGSTHTISQGTAGGNPGFFEQAVINVPAVPAGSTFGTAIARFNSGFVWDPSVDGALDSMHFLFDLRAFQQRSSTSSGSFYRPAILQDSLVFFLSPSSFVSSPLSQWALQEFDYDSGMNWRSFGGSLTPDFSATGSPVLFGYAVSLFVACPGTSGTCAAGLPSISGLDNYEVRLTAAQTPGPTEIPEPTTLALLGAGLLSIAFVRRKSIATR